MIPGSEEYMSTRNVTGASAATSQPNQDKLPLSTLQVKWRVTRKDDVVEFDSNGAKIIRKEQLDSNEFIYATKEKTAWYKDPKDGTAWIERFSLSFISLEELQASIDKSLNDFTKTLKTLPDQMLARTITQQKASEGGDIFILSDKSRVIIDAHHNCLLQNKDGKELVYISYSELDPRVKNIVDNIASNPHPNLESNPLSSSDPSPHPTKKSKTGDNTEETSATLAATNNSGEEEELPPTHTLPDPLNVSGGEASSTPLSEAPAS